MKDIMTRLIGLRRSQVLTALVAAFLSFSLVSAPTVFAANKQVAKASVVKPQKLTKVNINAASIKDLVNLKGIGEKKAIAIVKYRNEKGKFKKLEQLAEVKGIGMAIVEKNRRIMTL